jgi:hypothetical protein
LSSTQAGKGRKRGSKNKTTADVRAVAQGYTAEAILTLVALMRGKKTPPRHAPTPPRPFSTAATIGHLKRRWGESGPRPVTV